VRGSALNISAKAKTVTVAKGVKGRRWRGFRSRFQPRLGVGPASSKRRGDGGRKKGADKQPDILPPAGPWFGICPESAENFHSRVFPDSGNSPQSPANQSSEQRNFADGTERRLGRTKRWRSRSRGVLGQASLPVIGSCPLAESLAWGRAVLTRRASTQAEWRPSQRGVESVKFGCEFSFHQHSAKGRERTTK
jgi:hypothetical protein